MSEFGCEYRVHGWTQEDALDFLGRVKGYSVAPFAQDPSYYTFCQTSAEDRDDWEHVFRLSSGPDFTQISIWNLDVIEMIVDGLMGERRDCLTYVYHTGAGFDELKVYLKGQEVLLEDLGECFAFRCEGVELELAFDYDYRPGSYEPHDETSGWSNKLHHYPERTLAIEQLAQKMGDAASLIPGWELLAHKDWPLYYIEGLT